MTMNGTKPVKRTGKFHVLKFLQMSKHMLLQVTEWSVRSFTVTITRHFIKPILTEETLTMSSTLPFNSCSKRELFLTSPPLYRLRNTTSSFLYYILHETLQTEYFIAKIMHHILLDCTIMNKQITSKNNFIKLFTQLHVSTMGRDSSVGIATRCGLDSPGIESKCGRDFPHPSRPAPGPTLPPIQLEQGPCRE
jgi:hypothetical protein